MVKQTRGYRVWDPTSEEALKQGVRKHGLGAWEHIRKDPQFAILSDRTGVQLKDKWRNLVKFRHIDPDEQRTYKPKTQGPWSKKYKRERSQGLSGTASPASGDGGASEDEGGNHNALQLQVQANGSGALDGPDPGPAQQQQVLGAQRQSGRTNAQKRKAITDLALLLEGDGEDCYPHGSEDDERGGGGDGEGGGEGGGGRRGRAKPLGRPMGRSSSARLRKTQEDRRFGIYDRRRYGFAEDGSGVVVPRGRSYDGEGSDDGHASDAEGGLGGHRGGGGSGSAAAPPRLRRRGVTSRRNGGRGMSDDEDEEEEDDEEPEEASEEGLDDEGGQIGRRRTTAPGGGRRGGGGGDGGGGEDIINCPCGVTFDDGEMMIECESCAAWAHTACLKRQMALDPARYRYDFETYHCVACQETLRSLQQQGDVSPPGRGAGQGAAAAAAAGGLGALRPPGAPHGLGGARRGGGPGVYGRRGAPRGAVASSAALQMMPEPDDGDGGDGGGDGDDDTASEDSQRKASELSNILLGLANGHLGSGPGGGAGGRRTGRVLPNAPPGFAAAGSARPGAPLGRATSAPEHQASGGGGDGGRNGSGDGGAGARSPLVRSTSLGRTSSSGLAAAAGGTNGGGAQAAGSLDGGSRVLLKPGPTGLAAEGVRRGLMPGPSSSTGSKGRLDGAGSPPPLPDGGLPLFQVTAGPSSGAGNGAGGAGSGAGPKIFKPIPKLATAPGVSEPARQPQHQQLSAPKARPHPALQHGASQNSMQRMLEAANPLSAATAIGGIGPGTGAGGSRSLALSSVLEAAGPLQVAAANLCAASGRKPSVAATAAGPAAVSTSNGGAPAASDGVGSCDAAGATAAGGLPPRPPSRPPSSMAREIANRIFGESDDDDAGGLGRPLSALRGATGDPWFLMPPSLSRAATPSAFIDTILRATPDIAPLMGTSPPPHLAAALAAVRSASPGAAYLPALLAQQQQQQAAMQQFLQQSAAPAPVSAPSSNPLQPGHHGSSSAAAAAAAAAAPVILPPPPLVRPTPLVAPPPPPFAPPPVPIGGGPPGWPPGVPPPLAPPPGSLHPPPNPGEPVTLHPVLRHLLFTTAQQHQAQQQQQQAQQQQQSQQQQQAQCANGSGMGGAAGPLALPGPGPLSADGSGIRVKEEPSASGPSPPPLPLHQQQQHFSQSHPQQQSAVVARGPSNGGSAGGDHRGSRGGGCQLSGQSGALHGAGSGTQLPLTLPQTGPSGAAGSNGGQGGQGRDATAATAAGGAAMLAAAAAAASAAAAAGTSGGSLAGAGGSSGGGLPPGLDGGGNSVAALLGLPLHLNLMDHLRSSSPDPWGFFRTNTPGPEALLQGFLHPPPSVPVDMNSLPWLKSTTPPLSSGADLHMDR